MHHRLPRSIMRATLGMAVAALLAPLAVFGGTSPLLLAQPVAAQRPAAADRPNIVLVVTDDQRAETLAGMPQVRRLLVKRGTRFPHAMVPTPLCCPSRATILTGLYSHGTQVYGNGLVGGTQYGGWPAFSRQGLERKTLGTALHDAGYRTGIFGKYLNHFSTYAPKGYRPPGWDKFLVFAGPNSAYYNYRLSDGTRYGSRPKDYSTDVLARRARAFVKAAPADRPVFVLLTPYGPHRPYLAAPRHADAPVQVPRTRTERATSADTVDELSERWPGPPAMPASGQWTASRRFIAQTELPTVAEDQMRSLLAVDEAVGSLVRTMEDTGRAHNTLFVFMSDNGYLWGEHGLLGKDSPFDAASRVPLVVRWDDRVPAGRVDRRLALNVDIATTLTRAAGGALATEGLDLLGSSTRSGFVVEGMAGNWGRPAYCGWRTRDRLYIRWSNGNEDLYDHRLDPGEEVDLADLAGWAEVKEAMRAQARQACRPEPPGFDW